MIILIQLWVELKPLISRMQKLDLLSGSPAGSSSPLYPPLFTTGTTSPVKYPSLSSVDCEVCQRSIPESEIATHRASDEHLNNYRLYLGPSSWPANVHPAKDGGFRCTWCDKLLLGRDQLIGHLMGKEHNKRCQNSSIVPYGEDGHDAQVAEYVANYGNDPYARLKHWPVSIEDLGQFWICRLCGGERKKFQTQSAVNEHLNSSSHIALSSHGTAPMAPAATVSPKRPMDTSPARGAGWPECIALDDAYFWKCRLCNKQFNSPEHVEAHLSSDRHKSKMGRAALSPTGNFELFETSIQQKARAKMDRREMGRWIDRDRLECGLCVRKFSSLKEADHHFDELDHLCQWYTESIEKVISN